jgi:hypothetical protein
MPAGRDRLELSTNPDPRLHARPLQRAINLANAPVNVNEVRRAGPNLRSCSNGGRLQPIPGG